MPLFKADTCPSGQPIRPNSIAPVRALSVVMTSMALGFGHQVFTPKDPVMRYFVSLAVGLSLAGCGGSAPLAPSPEVLNESFDAGIDDLSQTTASPSADDSFANLLNNVRIDTGVGAVRYDARLDAAAQGHADDMIARNYFRHDSPEGDYVEDRVLAQGYDAEDYGENIAANQRTAQEALDGWQDSTSHNEMMTSDSFEDFGFGYSAKGAATRWVLVMGKEAE